MSDDPFVSVWHVESSGKPLKDGEKTGAACYLCGKPLTQHQLVGWVIEDDYLVTLCLRCYRKHPEMHMKARVDA